LGSDFVNVFQNAPIDIFSRRYSARLYVGEALSNERAKRFDIGLYGVFVAVPCA
jgi:hypothetical protein